jgi:phosphoglycerate dehydrogenase-like enzyme
MVHTMTCIINCLPLNDEERRRFQDAGGDIQQEFVGDFSTRRSLSWQASIPEEFRAQATAVIGNAPASQLRDCPQLQWLQTFSAGVDGYLKPGALATDVQVTSASGAYGQAVSEHLFAMTLSLMKNLMLYRDRQHEHRWEPSGHVGSLDGANVLVLGTGDIGAHFARLCKACGSHTIGVRRNAKALVDSIDDMHSFEDLDDLLKQADVVALALPSTPETRHIINADRLSLMRDNAIVVNAGRGDAIDCDALAQALSQQHISAAGLDVTDPEPLPVDHPLWDEPRCLITPHIAGGTHLQSTADRIIAIALENVRRYAQGQALNNRMR